MLALVAKGRREADLDSLELQTTAAFNGQMFARTQRLSGRTLAEFMPRREPVDKAALLEAKLAEQDAWMEGVNKRFARIDEAQAKAGGH